MSEPGIVAAEKLLGSRIERIATAETSGMAVALVSDTRGTQFLVFAIPGANAIAEHVTSTDMPPGAGRPFVSKESEVIRHLWSAAYGQGVSTPVETGPGGSG